MFIRTFKFKKIFIFKLVLTDLWTLAVTLNTLIQNYQNKLFTEKYDSLSIAIKSKIL